MTWLLFSDLHAHPWPEASRLQRWQGRYWINSRLLDAYRVMLWVLHAARRLGITHVAHLGDLKHVRGVIHSDVLMVLADACQRYRRQGVTLHLLVGNHDYDGLCQTHPLRAFEGVKVYDDVGTVKAGSATVGFVPYRATPDAVLDAYRSVRHASVILGHVALNGVPQRAGYIWGQAVEAEALPKRTIWSGHYHDPSRAGQVQYVGAAMQHGWHDEGGVRQAWVVDMTGATVPSTLAIPAPTFLTSPAATLPADCRGRFVRVLVPDTWPVKKRDRARQTALDRGARWATVEAVTEAVARTVGGPATTPMSVRKLVLQYAASQHASASRRRLGLAVLKEAEQRWAEVVV